MQKHIRQKMQHGSSSILVMMLLLMLTVFGVLAFSTTTANYRLSKKNADQIASWYRLDRLGEVKVSRLARLSTQASHGALDYCRTHGFLNINDTRLDTATRKMILAEWAFLTGKEERDAFLEVLYPKLYYFEFLETIQRDGIDPQSIISLYDFSDLSVWSSNAVLPVGSLANIRVEIADDKNPQAGTLLINLDVQAPHAGDDAYLKIVRWKQNQEGFQYVQKTDLWEGIVK